MVNVQDLFKVKSLKEIQELTAKTISSSQEEISNATQKVIDFQKTFATALFDNATKANAEMLKIYKDVFVKTEEFMTASLKK